MIRRIESCVYPWGGGLEEGSAWQPICGCLKLMRTASSGISHLNWGGLTPPNSIRAARQAFEKGKALKWHHKNDRRNAASRSGGHFIGWAQGCLTSVVRLQPIGLPIRAGAAAAFRQRCDEAVRGHSASAYSARSSCCIHLVGRRSPWKHLNTLLGNYWRLPRLQSEEVYLFSFIWANVLKVWYLAVCSVECYFFQW